MARDTTLDIVFNCLDNDASGNEAKGIIKVYVTVAGSCTVMTDPASIASVVAHIKGSWVDGTSIGADDTHATVRVRIAAGYFSVEPFKKNWVKWSKIGNLDFTIDGNNVAGEREMDWKGWVWKTKKLKGKKVIYGENGISIMTPTESSVWGYETISRVGLKGKNAMAGTDLKHFFVNNLGELWVFSEGLKKLDYSEYLSPMLANMVLSYDEANDLLYICDGAKGYVYRNGSLGEGPANVTGIGSQSGIIYPVAPAAIVIPALEICTDIYDLGVNRYKTVFELQFATNITGTLQAAMDYRADVKAAFSQTEWKDVMDRGAVLLTALGREIRFRLKLTAYEYCEMDYIKILGVIHAH
jgi:hypothetical protein